MDVNLFKCWAYSEIKGPRWGLSPWWPCIANLSGRDLYELEHPVHRNQPDRSDGFFLSHMFLLPSSKALCQGPDFSFLLLRSKIYIRPAILGHVRTAGLRTHHTCDFAEFCLEPFSCWKRPCVLRLPPHPPTPPLPHLACWWDCTLSLF